MIPVSMSNYNNMVSRLYSQYGVGGVSQTSPLSAPNPALMGMATRISRTQADAFAQERAKALSGLVPFAKSLQQSAGALDQSKTGNVYKQMTVTSTTPQVSGTALAGAPAATLKVDVAQIATAQSNQGSKLSDNAASTLGAGTQTLQITAGGKSTNVSVVTTGTETQLGALQRMAKAINDANAGVKAEVKSDSTTGKSQLVITGNKTGAANGITVSDVAGGAVAWAGVSSATTSAQDAQYSVNGVSYTSDTNTVKAPGLTTLTLSGPATGATLTVGQDTKAVGEAVSKFVSDYNGMVSYMKDNAKYLSPTLSQQMQRAFSPAGADLKSAGITQNSDGTLSLDTKKLDSALTKDFSGTTRAIGGTLGFAGPLSSLMTEVTSRPLSNYGAKSPQALSGYGQMTNTSARPTTLAYLSQIYSPLINAMSVPQYTGGLLDQLV